MAKTGIPYATSGWNPIIGCSPVSTGCDHCWARELHNMRHRAYLAGKKLPAQYAKPFNEIQIIESRLDEPLHWRKPQAVFVCPQADLFHPDVPFDFVLDMLGVIVTARNHIFMVFTKRLDRAIEFTKWHESYALRKWPTNVMLIASVEDQASADERIPKLLSIPAAMHGVSIEPMLGPVDLTRIKWAKLDVNPVDYVRYGVPAPDEMWSTNNTLESRPADNCNKAKIGLDWVICGGESDKNARPMHPNWARSLRDQCKAASVPFYFKQWGAWAPKPFNADNPQRPGLKDRWVNLAGGHGFHGESVVLMTRVGRKAVGKALDGEIMREVPWTEARN